MSQAVLLLQLQELDNEILADKAQLTAVLKAMQEPDALAVARENLDSAETAFGTASRKQTDLDLQLSTLNAKYKASHDRLYSGKVTSSRELSDLQQELEMLKRQRATLEDTVLENMLLVEETAESKESAETRLQELVTGWNSRYAQMEREKGALARKLGGALEKRKAHAKRVELKYLKKYQEIAKKRKGSAVAVLRNEECIGCRTRVSLATKKQVGEGQIAYCGSCSRILVLG